MDNKITKEAALQLNQAKDVIWSAMNLMIKKQGYSDLTLHLEGSYYEISDILSNSEVVSNDIKLFYVYKKDWYCNTEEKGFIVKSTDWKSAKAIAMKNINFKEESRINVIVEEVDSIEENILYSTVNIRNNITCN
ncbi:hypothetical protein FJQ98_16235 [Lysinibacillus agricola]|uniref:Uncharacterized protein n=1 Tax=Lysinibacillus agricola TaxID=2590012 RepID=A0ABX7ALT8_9BACI|nr:MULTISPECIES: hypothetical protein [Lysinibacillus]KOS61513.1 hypothetical protein AN161_18155 [Lysinibacillus sp. FJAT-14222]QQP10794.1 hypothetical protein FJQ98_16235 [Lysinibacillus agricola]